MQESTVSLHPETWKIEALGTCGCCNAPFISSYLRKEHGEFPILFGDFLILSGDSLSKETGVYIPEKKKLKVKRR